MWYRRILIMRDLRALKALRIGILLAGIGITACDKKAPPVTATLTLKRDGSTFTGTVMRRETNSITVTSPAGETHTFLYTELTDIKTGAPGSPEGSKPASQDASSQSASAQHETPSDSGVSSANSAPAPKGGVIQFPEGTEFPVRSSGFLDSCCVPEGALSVGVVDSNIKSPESASVIPEGSNVTMVLMNKTKVDGRVAMVFELATADFGGRHFIVSSARGGSEPGARVTVSGAKEGSPEAKARGLAVHVDDNSVLEYKALTPVVFKVSQ